jgi:hypothetical protein
MLSLGEPLGMSGREGEHAVNTAQGLSANGWIEHDFKWASRSSI